MAIGPPKDKVRTLLIICIAGAGLWYVFGGQWDRDTEISEGATAKRWCRENATQCIKVACDELEPDSCRSTAAQISDANQRGRDAAKQFIQNLTAKSTFK